MTRVAPLAAAFAVLALLLLGPVGGGAGARVVAMGELPPCRYDDVLTSPRGYDDWQATLVDTILRVQQGYAPPDLVSISLAGLPDAEKVIRAVAIDDLRAMVLAARAADAPIGVESAYRSYADQRKLFDAWNPAAGSVTDEAPARPGHSEHQLGLAIDFRSAAADAQAAHERFVTTPGGRWMAANAWQFGWVMSYPAGADDRTCYAFEPWHYRYVGREEAAQVHASGLTLREFLWRRFTMTVVPISQGPVFGPIGSGVPILAAPGGTAGPPSEQATGQPAPTTEPTDGPAASPAAVVTPAASEPSIAAPGTDAVGSIDAGAAVVAGALAMVIAALAGVLLAGRRRRPG